MDEDIDECISLPIGMEAIDELGLKKARIASLAIWWSAGILSHSS